MVKYKIRQPEPDPEEREPEAVDDGGPAFPADSECPDSTPGERKWSGHPGMTLRDWFAGMAMQGVWSNPDVDAGQTEIATVAYQQADAMLAHRNQRERGGE